MLTHNVVPDSPHIHVFPQSARIKAPTDTQLGIVSLAQVARGYPTRNKEASVTNEGYRAPHHQTHACGYDKQTYRNSVRAIVSLKRQQLVLYLEELAKGPGRS